MDRRFSRSRSLPLLNGNDAEALSHLPPPFRVEARATQLIGSSAAGTLCVGRLEVVPQVEFVRLSRSQSAPSNITWLNTKIIRKARSCDGALHVVPSPLVSEIISNLPDTVTLAIDNGGDGQDVMKEEAVCRICLDELSEGSDTFKLECHCKGELALAHKECAVKWFSLRGNRNCEVCKQEVLNLSVKLVRTRAGIFYQARTWENFPSFAVVSIFAYFCVLEEILIGSHGWRALAISLPLACILGPLSSLTSIIMTRPQLVWIHATVQLFLVAFFAQLFYSCIRIQGVVSIILGGFVGIGIALGGKFVAAKFLAWRANRHEQRRRALRSPGPRGSSSEANRAMDVEHQV